MSQLFQRDFRPPGKTQIILEAAAGREHVDISNQPRKATQANPLPLLLLPDCSARGKTKNAADWNYSWTAETPNYHSPHVFNVWGCLYVNNTWKQRNLMPVKIPPQEACQQKAWPEHTAPAGTISMQPNFSMQVPVIPHFIPEANGDKPCLQLSISLAKQKHCERGTTASPHPHEEQVAGATDLTDPITCQERVWKLAERSSSCSGCSSGVRKYIQIKTLCKSMPNHRGRWFNVWT